MKGFENATYRVMYSEYCMENRSTMTPEGFAAFVKRIEKLDERFDEIDEDSS
jgi:hypothetical protein